MQRISRHLVHQVRLEAAAEGVTVRVWVSRVLAMACGINPDEVVQDRRPGRPTAEACRRLEIDDLARTSGAECRLPDEVASGDRRHIQLLHFSPYLTG
jgi:hypothetical protein